MFNQKDLIKFLRKALKNKFPTIQNNSESEESSTDSDNSGTEAPEVFLPEKLAAGKKKIDDVSEYISKLVMSPRLNKIKLLYECIPAGSNKLESDFSRVSDFHRCKRSSTKREVMESLLLASEDPNLEKIFVLL